MLVSHTHVFMAELDNNRKITSNQLLCSVSPEKRMKMYDNHFISYIKLYIRYRDVENRERHIDRCVKIYIYINTEI